MQGVFTATPFPRGISFHPNIPLLFLGDWPKQGPRCEQLSSCLETEVTDGCSSIKYLPRILIAVVFCSLLFLYYPFTVFLYSQCKTSVEPPPPLALGYLSR